VNDLLIVGGVIVFVILAVIVIKKFGTIKLPPLLKKEEVSTDETGNKITKVFWEICGRKFTDQEKPEAIEYGKECVKIR